MRVVLVLVVVLLVTGGKQSQLQVLSLSLKFDNIHKIVKNHQIIFCKDPCTHVRTRGVNVCTRVSSNNP